MPLNIEKKNNDLRPVFIAYPSIYSLLILNYLVNKAKLKFSAIVLADSHIKVKKKVPNVIQSVLLLIKKSGLRYGLYMLFVSKFAYLIVGFWSIISLFSGQRLVFKSFRQIAKEQGVPLWKSRDVNNETTVVFMKRSGANIIVSAYNNQIIRYKTCKKFTHKGINIHNSYLPDFAGLDAAFENLYYKVKAGGATVHYLDKGIDSGDIIKQVKVNIHPGDSVFSLNIREWLEGAKMLFEVLEFFKNDDIPRIKQNPHKAKYPYQTFPEKERVEEFLKKRGRLIAFSEIIVPSKYLYNLFT